MFLIRKLHRPAPSCDCLKVSAIKTRITNIFCARLSSYSTFQQNTSLTKAAITIHHLSSLQYR